MQPKSSLAHDFTEEVKRMAHYQTKMDKRGLLGDLPIVFNGLLVLLNDLLVPSVVVVLVAVELPSRVQLALVAGALLWLWFNVRKME